MSFESLGLSDYMLAAIEAVGYKVPTPIQKESIPLVLEGNDLIIQAKTGTGKTAAYALPMLQVLNDTGRTKKKVDIQALILVPTRELALQVAKAFEIFGQSTERFVRVLAVIGGEDVEQQKKELRFGYDIVVATPGRFLEVVRERSVRFQELRCLVLDEADKLLDQGFADEVDDLLKMLPEERQTLLVSATFPDKVEALSERVLMNPTHIKSDKVLTTVENIKQRVIEVNRDNRGPLLRHLIKTEDWKHVLIFVGSKRTARNLTAKLKRDGISAEEFHGNLKQKDRVNVLKQFHNRNIQVLVATDLAARGIDIHKLAYVLNYDLPRSPKEYIHRIGRTGRAGANGVAVSFIGHEDMDHFALIEKRCNVSVEREQVDGFNLTGSAAEKKKGGAPVKGKRKSKKDKLREAAQRSEGTTAPPEESYVDQGGEGTSE